MANKNVTTTTRPTGFAFNKVGSGGSYTTPSGSPDVKAAGKVADENGKSSSDSTGSPKTIPAMGDHKTCCGNGSK